MFLNFIKVHVSQKHQMNFPVSLTLHQFNSKSIQIYKTKAQAIL